MDTEVKNEKRKYDSDDSRRRLVRAGIDVFSKAGYEAATTRQIAKAAGVNESLIHRYFNNKLGLFFTILKEFHQRLTGSLSYAPCATVKEELTEFFRFRMEFGRKQKKLFKLSMSQAILDTKVRDELGNLARNATPALVSRLEKLRADGKIRSDINIEQLSMLVSGIAFSMSMLSHICFKLDGKMVQGVLDLAVTILSEGVSPKRS